MPFADSDLRALKPQAKQFRVATGMVCSSRLYERQQVIRLGGISGHTWSWWSAEVALHRCVWKWFRAMDPQATRDEKDRLDLLRKKGQNPLVPSHTRS